MSIRTIKRHTYANVRRMLPKRRHQRIWSLVDSRIAVAFDRIAASVEADPFAWVDQSPKSGLDFLLG